MNIYKIGREFIPPVFIKLLRRFRVSRTYPSYEDALKYCGVGYEVAGLVKVVVDKNEIFKQKLFSPHEPISSNDTRVIDIGALRTIIGIGIVSKGGTLNVLDFGGGGGYHYLIAKAVFGDRINLRWNVVETSAMVAEARRMEDGHLKYFDNIEKAALDLGTVDLVFTSGALQYTPDPVDSLKKLLNVNAASVFITRVGLSGATDKIIIQYATLSANGPGPLPEGISDESTAFPCSFVSLGRFEKALEEKYVIKLKICEDRAAYNAAGEVIDMYGYLCELKKDGQGG